MSIDPKTALETADASAGFVKQGLLWAAWAMGINTAPNLIIGPDHQHHGLPNDMRPAYRDWWQFQCRNVRRRGFVGLLGTDPAVNVRATIRVMSLTGEIVYQDQAVFVGGEAPVAQLTKLQPDDQRFAILSFLRASAYVPNPLRGGRFLQPGTYVTSSRAVLYGQWEQSRLPVGQFKVSISVEADNAAAATNGTTDLLVEWADPIEPDVVFSVPTEQPRSEDLYDKLNIQARTSKRFAKLDDVRLLAFIDGKQLPMNWSVNNGNMDGEATATLFPEQDVQVLVAARALSPSGVLFLGGAAVGPGHCYLTDVSFRVNKKPVHLLKPGTHTLEIRAICGTSQYSSTFGLKVPEDLATPMSISML